MESLLRKMIEKDGYKMFDIVEFGEGCVLLPNDTIRLTSILDMKKFKGDSFFIQFSNQYCKFRYRKRFLGFLWTYNKTLLSTQSENLKIINDGVKYKLIDAKSGKFIEWIFIK